MTPRVGAVDAFVGLDGSKKSLNALRLGYARTRRLAIGADRFLVFAEVLLPGALLLDVLLPPMNFASFSTSFVSLAKLV
jgi:hypothetical protein